jgi:DNA-binding response OmpR family regulator
LAGKHLLEASLATPDNEGVNGRPRPEFAGVRVLVVEDQWLVANALKLLLEAEGMAVSGPAATTADACRLARDRKLDLAVVDINLKGEKTYALIDQLRDQSVRIVVASGYAVIPEVTEKVAAVLQKPFSGHELRAALRRALSL